MYFLKFLIGSMVAIALACYCHASHPSGSDKGQASCVANYRPGGANETPAGWPYAPFRSHSRWILDSRGEIVTYAGANWPGSLRPMVPEGLQYASVDSIAEQIASLGMNVIRLSFATEMIDEIYNNGHDTNLKTTFVNALGEINGTKVYQNVLKHNPHFTSATTRLDVFDAVAAACARHGIWVHLDNHQARAGWCCNPFDGNGWFGDTFFNVDNWIRGLQYMAKHAASWPNFVSLSLYNELRPTPAPGYGWQGWYKNMIPAAKAVSTANPDILIFFSGLNSDTNISPLVSGQDLGPGNRFDVETFTFADKIVLELHDYSWDQAFSNCVQYDAALNSDGFYVLNMAAPDVQNRLPVVMTEFGFAPNTYTSLFAQCLKQFLISKHIGWTMWDISGSYYIRQGIQNYDEEWGLLAKDWSGWRNKSAIQNYYRPLIQASLDWKWCRKLTDADNASTHTLVNTSAHTLANTSAHASETFISYLILSISCWLIQFYLFI